MHACLLPMKLDEKEGDDHVVHAAAQRMRAHQAESDNGTYHIHRLFEGRESHLLKRRYNINEARRRHKEHTQ